MTRLAAAPNSPLALALQNSASPPPIQHVIAETCGHVEAFALLIIRVSG
jgi:hypothetical protein